jgi:UrcA family protein
VISSATFCHKLLIRHDLSVARRGPHRADPVYAGRRSPRAACVAARVPLDFNASSARNQPATIYQTTPSSQAPPTVEDVRFGGNTNRNGCFTAESSAFTLLSLFHVEIKMNANADALNTRSCACLGAAAVCLLLSGTVEAADKAVTVKVAVSSAGLNVSEPGGAHTFYGRLRQAARVVCGRGNLVGLQPVENFSGCYETALADAVRSVNRPGLTSVYLETHTMRDAVQHGIELQEQIASK